MKFGSVPVSEAGGAILAHSLQGATRRLRKGLFLDADDLKELSLAGHDTVVVAQPEDGDLHEDDAAAIFAASLVPNPDAVNLQVANPFTGRVNIYANCNGIAEIDEVAIAKANAIDPMITVATVAPFARMRDRGMVATIKIISYAVASRDMDQVIVCAQDAIRLKVATYRTVSLILTETEADTALQDEKGIKAIKNRLAALDVTLCEVLVCRHEIKDLSQALLGAKGAAVMILTASATSDPLDVGPQSLREAGGSVTRFGMPVDPGNLLFYGVLRDGPVIGLPGCVRSPVMNGADWVMERLLCGVEIEGADIAAMGVGGLLKEIPSRPQPRDRKR
ncbi:MAG: molybdopterin-binding protein [Pseudoruegeria sp.]